MPTDIRSFFGAKGAAAPKPQEKAKPEATKKGRGNKRVIVDSDDEDDTPVEAKKAPPKRGRPKKSQADEPVKGEETSTADYFASSKKTKGAPPKATQPIATQPIATQPIDLASSPSTPKKLAKQMDGPPDSRGSRASARKTKAAVKYTEISDDDDDVVEVAQPKKAVAKPRSAPVKEEDDFDMKDPSSDDEDNFEPAPEPVAKRGATRGRPSNKRKSTDLDDDDEEDDFEEPKKSAKSKPAAKPPAKKRAPAAKKVDVPESAEMRAIFDSIPLVRAPTPPPQDPDAKFDWRKAAGNANSGPPPASGSKEIPEGADNCLAGLTFVFTGILDTISRDEGQALVKKYGGRVTGAPSKNTSFVVLGNDAGPSKLRKIHDLKIKTINEDGLFALIRAVPANGGDGKAAEKNAEKQRLEQEKIKKEAEKMEKEERQRAAEAEKARKAAEKAGAPAMPRKPLNSADGQLMTVKYAPTQMAHVMGNKTQVEKIQNWLKLWPKYHKYDFQKKGADGSGGFRAILIHGPPGIGKTTAAHLAAKLEGYDIIESNASDTRSKKLVETGLRDVLNNTSLLGFLAGDGKAVDEKKKKIVLIMDEVDGMSAGDRGGVGALAKICKTTDIPMILICNDRNAQKMKPFDHVTYDVPFRRPTVEQVRSRIATICLREGLKLPITVIDALIEGSNKDIRQIINMISTIKLDQTAMDFDSTKSMTKAWEKHVVLKPWDICHKLLGSGLFAPSSKATLNDKIELYFNDHEFSYLMLQENYLTTKPMLASNAGYNQREQRLKTLELVDKAAESISDGDLVDRMIHGSQQQWSLMPTHAVFSAVRPASFMSGAMTGRTEFTKWLGNNSKQGKLTRYVKEIQSHMRLRTSGDRHEIRQQYLPVLWTKIVKRLEAEGKECVEEVIDLMDNYFLTREDFDYMMELGLGPQDEKNVKIDTQAKSAFTRSYNGRSHPMPFMKASNVIAPAKVAKEKPDLEEALEEEEEEAVIEEPKEEDDEELDLSKDKYIKKPKAKKAPAAKGKKRAKADDDSEDDVKPKKAKAKAAPKKAAAKGKAKK